jgi:hypothetical protein
MARYTKLIRPQHFRLRYPLSISGGIGLNGSILISDTPTWCHRRNADTKQ